MRYSNSKESLPIKFIALIAIFLGEFNSFWQTMKGSGGLSGLIVGLILALFLFMLAIEYGKAQDALSNAFSRLFVILSILLFLVFSFGLVVYFLPTPAVYGYPLQPPKPFGLYSITLDPNDKIHARLNIPIPQLEHADLLAIKFEPESEIQSRINRIDLSVLSALPRPASVPLAPYRWPWEYKAANKTAILFVENPQRVSEVSVRLGVKAFVCKETSASIFVSYEGWVKTTQWRVLSWVLSRFPIKPLGSF